MLESLRRKVFERTGRKCRMSQSSDEGVFDFRPPPNRRIRES
jgi:hypothetical protein